MSPNVCSLEVSASHVTTAWHTLRGMKSSEAKRLKEQEHENTHQTMCGQRKSSTRPCFKELAEGKLLTRNYAAEPLWSAGSDSGFRSGAACRRDRTVTAPPKPRPSTRCYLEAQASQSNPGVLATVAMCAGRSLWSIGACLLDGWSVNQQTGATDRLVRNGFLHVVFCPQRKALESGKRSRELLRPRPTHYMGVDFPV